MIYPGLPDRVNHQGGNWHEEQLIPIKKGEPEQVRHPLVVERNPKEPGVRDEENQPHQRMKSLPATILRFLFDNYLIALRALQWLAAGEFVDE